MKKTNAIWWLPLLFLIIIAPFTPWLDIQISNLFYSNGEFQNTPFTSFLFTYGVLPTNITVGIAVIGLIGSFFYRPWKKYQGPALFLILTLAIGSGLIIHGILKDHWGRPRPRQVIEFGGIQEFRPFYKPNFFQQPEPSKSFPSGHASMGFFFFAIALLGWYYRRKSLFWLGLSLAIILGFLLSWTRIAQGGHFFSDTLIAGLIMFYCSLIFSRILIKSY